MKKRAIIILIIIGAFFLFVVFGLLGYKYFKEKPMRDFLRKQARENAPPTTYMKKKAAIIIAFKDFRDEEYFKTHDILFKGETEIKIVSTKKGTAIGADGGEVNIDFTLDELRVEDFDAIIFIGGPGALDCLDNEKSYSLARKTIEKNKILGAICISPTIIAKAGVLRGKKATVWASSLDRKPIKILEENGADFVNEKVVQDGNIITANGPVAAPAFAEKILYNLKHEH